MKMRRDKSFIKTKLETQHPARQYIQVWDRLGYEVDKVTGNILIILDDTRIVIQRGVDESGQVTGQMRRKISKLLHVPHLGEVKTARAAERRYYWPSMYHQVRQEVKGCEACRNNAKNQAPEPPAGKHEFTERPMQKMSSDIFHFGSQNWLILFDWYSGFSFSKRL